MLGLKETPRSSFIAETDELHDEKYTALKEVFLQHGHKESDSVAEETLWFNSHFYTGPDPEENFLYIVW